MDIIVTIPKSFTLRSWIDEGSDLPGAPWSGEEWHYYLGGSRPNIRPGERVYCCYSGHLIGYAPLVRIEDHALVRRGGAVAVTVSFAIPGFRGFRYRWWNRRDEIAFAEWMSLAEKQVARHA
jgi:hypothetical protein